MFASGERRVEQDWRAKLKIFPVGIFCAFFQSWNRWSAWHVEFIKIPFFRILISFIFPPFLFLALLVLLFSFTLFTFYSFCLHFSHIFPLLLFLSVIYCLFASHCVSLFFLRLFPYFLFYLLSTTSPIFFPCRLPRRNANQSFLLSWQTTAFFDAQ